MVLNKQLSLPGIGILHLQRTSSTFDFGNKTFSAPRYFFSLENADQSPSRKLFEWLSQVMMVSEWEAIKMVNDFSFDLKNQVAASVEVSWKNVGKFFRDDKGNLVLDSYLPELESEQPVIADKVIREKAEHTVMVGMNERTAMEMEAYSYEASQKKDYGWIIAIIIIVISFIMVGIYFSEKGLDPSSVGNQHIIQSR